MLSSLFFGGITGAATADVAALGPILIPAMEKQGYRRDFATAVTVASSLCGPLIPPSIPMLVYGISSGHLDRRPVPGRRHAGGRRRHRAAGAQPLPAAQHAGGRRSAGRRQLDGPDGRLPRQLPRRAAGPADARHHRRRRHRRHRHADRILGRRRGLRDGRGPGDADAETAHDVEARSPRRRSPRPPSC